MIDKLLLFPYYLTLKLRHLMYDRGFIVKSRCPDLPTVCVGNVTVGGTGKTPHTEMILRMLCEDRIWRYHPVAVLSRGYKRKTRGFRLLPDPASARLYGDEPAQVKNKFPEVCVAVDKNRLRGCEILSGVRKLSGVDVPRVDMVILDDAYQYRKLKAKFNVVLVDYSRPIFSDHLLPLGHLRDLPSRAGRADVIIVSKSPYYMEDSERNSWAQKLGLKDFNPGTCRGVSPCGKPQLLLFTNISYCHPIPVFPECDPRYVYSKKLVLFTGIASDLPLRRYLSDTYQIVDHIKYKDHHRFSKSDIRSIASLASKYPTAAFMTTQKDAQRLLDCKDMPSVLKERLFQVPIEVAFITENEQKLFNEALLDSVRMDSLF